MNDISSGPANPPEQMDPRNEHVVCELLQVPLLAPPHTPVVSGRRDAQPQASWMEHSPWGTWPQSKPPIWGQDSCSTGLQLARAKVSSPQRSWDIKDRGGLPCQALCFAPLLHYGCQRDAFRGSAASPPSSLSFVAGSTSSKLCWPSLTFSPTQNLWQSVCTWRSEDAGPGPAM